MLLSYLPHFQASPHGEYQAETLYDLDVGIDHLLDRFIRREDFALQLQYGVPEMRRVALRPTRYGSESTAFRERNAYDRIERSFPSLLRLRGLKQYSFPCLKYPWRADEGLVAEQQLVVGRVCVGAVSVSPCPEGPEIIWER